MVGRLRLIVALIWAVTLVLLAGAVVGLSNGTGTAGAHPLTLQPAAVDAPASRAANVPTTPAVVETTTTSTSTTVPPTTVAPTTVAPTTAPPTTARTTPPPPRTTPPTVARPTVTAPPATAAPVTPATGGSASDYSLIGYKWNPCQVITIASSGPDVSAIVAELASITGLRLQVVNGPAAITVGWGSVPAGGEIGETLWRAVGGLLSGGNIVISQAAQPYLATVLRHELAHSLGLGHASQPNEVMYPSVGNSSPTDYQAGDLAGLRAVGAASGSC
jgi:Matrixin